jgi:hypothetical protein
MKQERIIAEVERNGHDVTPALLSRRPERGATMTVSPGLKLLGIVLAFVGSNDFVTGHALSEPVGRADLATGLLMLATGTAVFILGFRRRAC